MKHLRQSVEAPLDSGAKGSGEPAKTNPPEPSPAAGPDTDVVLDAVRRLVDSGQTAVAFRRLNEMKATRIPVRGVDHLRAQCFVKERQLASAIEALKEELRYFPDHTAAADLLESLAPDAPSEPAGRDPEFCEIREVIKPYTMVGEARLLSLFEHARKICRRDVPGNFAECGVAAGGTSALLASVISRHSQRPRKLFSFDTFEGMPAASERDVAEGKSADDTGWGAGTCAAPESSLREVCGQLGVEKLVEPIRGLFADTLPVHRARVGPLAFLHMDGDWYSSTRDILENLFDQVVPGGFIQVDDYGHWEGCRQAFTEFTERRGLKLKFHRIDETGVWLAK